MKEPHEKKRSFVAVIGNVALALMGLAIALGLVEMLMRTFPNWVPAEVRVNPPARRMKAFIDATYDLRQSDGDLYHLMRGAVPPVSPDQDQVVAHIHMMTDAHGFRNAPPEKATYGIVAVGDSFTRASGVASPWTHKLAEYTGADVLNLGDVGFGPQDELKVLQQYGLRKEPQWVIMAYFEGNDLYDAASYDQATPFILLRFGRYILRQGVESWQERRSEGAQGSGIPTYRYPITTTINNKQLEMVFFSSYISWLSLSKEAIAASQNYRLVTETILQAQELSEAAGANFLLVYLPSKSHVYLPYLNDPETLERVFVDVPRLELDDTGFIQFTDAHATVELTRQYMDDQAHLLADFAVEQQISFLDLTSTFQKEAGAGAELYYPFDTHWNQDGHNLAAQTIAGYLDDLLTVTTNKQP
jgi:SGNH hydrolase-like domain, acetyltransferase AlgX